jgi:predicted GH43/DUF377 family glycosyl hydrolase
MKRRELFTRHEENPVLTAEGWPYAVNTVFNPGACLDGDSTVLLVRVEDHRGHSHLQPARSKDGFGGWEIPGEPVFTPDPDGHPEETWGIEDPRITWLEERGEFAITYTGYSDRGPLVCLATTTDFRSYERLGAITTPENKDAAIFPRRIGGRWAMLHRPVPGMCSGAHMWISYSPDLIHWGDHRILMRARSGAWWDSGKIGGNNPPLETPEGWLVLYHGVRNTPAGCLYRLGLALLDLEDPSKVLHRSPGWIFGPKARYELDGDVGNVVFPCGWTLVGDEVRLYYGGADSCVAVATASLAELMEYLKECPGE